MLWADDGQSFDRLGPLPKEHFHQGAELAAIRGHV